MGSLMRSLFGIGDPPEDELSEEVTEGAGAKDLEYEKASEERLRSLFQLYTQYQRTAHGQKIKAVYEKTETIHNYLVSRNRLHELELFHIQKTEHFLNTFTAILNYHLNQPVKGEVARKNGSKAENLFRKFLNKQNKGRNKEEMIKPTDSQGRLIHTENAGIETPSLSVPEIAINTFATIKYRFDGLAEGEIGYTSTPEEKDIFLKQLSFVLRLEAISYIGNTLVTIPNNDGSHSTGLVPVIYWEGFLYVLNLNDLRLFPVKMYRKR